MARCEACGAETATTKRAVGLELCPACCEAVAMPEEEMKDILRDIEKRIEVLPWNLSGAPGEVAKIQELLIKAGSSGTWGTMIRDAVFSRLSPEDEEQDEDRGDILIRRKPKTREACDGREKGEVLGVRSEDSGAGSPGEE